MRRIVGPFLLLPILVLLLVAPVSAAPPVKDTATHDTLSVFISDCGPSTCTDTSWDVFPTSEGMIVICTFERTTNFRSGKTSEEQACSQEISASALDVSDDLSSASLSPTTVTFQTCDIRGCVEGDTVTLSIDLTGSGPVFSSTDRGTFSDGTCTFRFSSSTESRSGTGTLTIDGDTTAVDGGFGTGTFTFTERCREA